ncbi:NADP-dependent oxidoreductase [Kiloniella sp.]|uniref:NADP-dependent oxidoreductase n=1 Tax=Kiloniella sp. TaxID=1938587 RepID=UPI003B020BA6
MKGLVVQQKSKITMEYNLEKPSPSKGEVLIKIHSASVNPYDLESAAGNYDAYFKEYGFDKPVQTGLEFSGTVESIGSQFKIGDPVFGYVHLITGWKTHAEYIVVPETYIAPKPPSLTFEQAAAVPLGIMTSLAVYEDLAPNKSNMNVLIIGASGGVGIYATQIGKLLNHHIAAVVSKGHSDFIKKLGANESYEYNSFDITDLKEKYDLILDLSTRLILEDCQDRLSDDGIFIPALPDDHNGGNSENKQVGYLMVMHGHGIKLAQSTNWINANDLVPVIEANYTFDQYSEALAHLEQRNKKGRIIMTWPG